FHWSESDRRPLRSGCLLTTDSPVGVGNRRRLKRDQMVPFDIPDGALRCPRVPARGGEECAGKRCVMSYYIARQSLRSGGSLRLAVKRSTVRSRSAPPSYKTRCESNVSDRAECGKASPLAFGRGGPACETTDYRTSRTGACASGQSPAGSPWRATSR